MKGSKASGPELPGAEMWPSACPGPIQLASPGLQTKALRSVPSSSYHGPPLAQQTASTPRPEALSCALAWCWLWAAGAGRKRRMAPLADGELPLASPMITVLPLAPDHGNHGKHQDNHELSVSCGCLSWVFQGVHGHGIVVHCCS